jgi:N-acetyl-gamma-glutamyl-phosphate reductase
MAYGRLTNRPILAPSVGNFLQGMLVSLPLALDSLPGKPRATDLEAALRQHYAGATHVRVIAPEAGGKLEPQGLNGTNDLEIRVYAHAAHRQALVVARLDNLGKGASGAAVQNLELMLGL